MKTEQVQEQDQEWFGGIGGASAPGASNWFRRGVYVAEIVSIVRRVSQNPKKKGHKLVIATFRVVDVTVPYPESQRAGELASWHADLDDPYQDLHLGRLRQLIAAAVGDVSGLDEAGWTALAGSVTAPPGLELAGSRVLVDASAGTTTRKGDTIYPANFAPAPAPA